jgi:NitT/TauT family transport system ATP-binding protein
MQLEEAAKKYPRELSGGMQQRVALARALVCEPDLLILDEPFKAMDEALRDQVIAQVGKTSAAILLVTHEEWEAQALGCEIMRL